MTFGKTSDQENFRQRTASHSTKGRANGRVDVLPPTAKPNFSAPNPLTGQLTGARKTISLAEAALKNLDAQIRSGMPWQEKRRIRGEVGRLKKILMRAKTEAGQFEKTLRNAHEGGVAAAFYRLADAMLPKEIFLQIDLAARELIARGPT